MLIDSGPAGSGSWEVEGLLRLILLRVNSWKWILGALKVFKQLLFSGLDSLKEEWVTGETLKVASQGVAGDGKIITMESLILAQDER